MDMGEFEAQLELVLEEYHMIVEDYRRNVSKAVGLLERFKQKFRK
jgi:hypothetical protein